MSVSISRSSHARSLFFALALVVSGGALALVAAEKKSDADRPMVNVKLDTTAIPRSVASDLSFAPIVKQVMPSVVKVVVRENSKEVEAGERSSPFEDPAFRWFFGPNAPGGPNSENRRTLRQPPREGLGSGVIVSADGYIVTNNHVVDGADKVTVTLSDGRELIARVVGADEKTDVAVLRVEGETLPAITFANSEDIEVGDRVLAMGNPFGFGQTVTTGIVSGIGRSSRELGLDYQNFIQTDAAINPGNSGGALVDVRGRLIGINTAIYSRSGGFQGIGFAIPADMVRQIMDSLVQYGKVTRGFLGVMIQDVSPELAEQFKLKDRNGVVVTDVSPDSPAEKAGLKSGDVLTRFGKNTVENVSRLRLAVAGTPPGTEVEVRLVRGGEEQNVALTLGELPGEKTIAAKSGAQDAEGSLQGVAVGDLTPQLRQEFEIPARVQGAIVTGVDAKSASAEAGLQPGDVILEIAGSPVTSAADAIRLTESASAGKTLLRIWSRGGTHFLVVDESKR